MADIDSIDAPRELDFGKGATRVGLARQATYQLSTMLGVLLNIAEKEGEIDGHLMQAMGVRMIELNSVVMSAIDDGREEYDELCMRLYGHALEEEQPVFSGAI